MHSWDDNKHFVSNDDPVYNRPPQSEVGTIGQTRMGSNPNNRLAATSYNSTVAAMRRPQTSSSLDPHGFMGHDVAHNQVIFSSAPQVRPNLEEILPPQQHLSSSQTFVPPNTRQYQSQAPTQPSTRAPIGRMPMSSNYGAPTHGLHHRAPFSPEIDQLSTTFKNMNFSRNDYATGGSSYFDSSIREDVPSDFYLHDAYSLPEHSPLSFYSRTSPSPSMSPLASPLSSSQFPFQGTEIPSRLVVVRKLDMELDDNYLLSIFRQIGELKTFEPHRARACILLTYYDLRAAIQAVTTFKGRPALRFDVSFMQPTQKGNGPPQNQGTLVVFNLDINLKDDDLRMYFAPYGEIKEIRVSPKKVDQKFIEYYDTRCAENALNSLKGIVLGRYKINIEFSRPGGKQRLKDEETDMSRRSMSCPDRTVFSPPKPSIMSPRLIASPTPTSPMNYGFPSHILPPQVRSPSPSPNPNLFAAMDSIESRNPIGSPHNNTINNPLGNQLSSSFGSSSSNSIGNSMGNPLANIPMQMGGGSLVGGTLMTSSSSSLSGSGSGLPRGIDGNDIMNTFGENSNKQDESNYLSLDAIASGKDKRTTIMIKNIPNKYGNSAILQLINRRFKDKYDFWYLPIDFAAKSNFGFAFINFINYLDIIDFYNEFNGFTWPQYSSSKIVEIRYARLQGKLDLIRNFQNSSVVGCQHPPMLFKSDGPDRGQPEEWPTIPVGRRKM
eukprot:TRINITY_DN228_c0_g1_i2.p1 TRINITY_DN228_c0_g1~~TRINITY_DN228_c0_g1_i2.p1  ORF type:complete len:719 (-),score=88.91 TRINITY_DN228_c0_g1_i2:655-2811(-)